MNNNLQKSAYLRSTFLVVALCLCCHQSKAQISYPAIGQVIQENFDSLGANPNNTNQVMNAGVIPGLTNWFGNKSSVRTSSGMLNSTGRIYNWGGDGSLDRALGAHDEGATGVVMFGCFLRNDTTSNLTQFSLSFAGEQWRRNSTGGLLQMEYLITRDSGSQLSSAGYVPASNFDFRTASGSAGGGQIASTAISATVRDILWKPGEFLWLRWTNNDPVNCSGGGIDDLRFAANVVTPNPYPFTSYRFEQFLPTANDPNRSGINYRLFVPPRARCHDS